MDKKFYWVLEDQGGHLFVSADRMTKAEAKKRHKVFGRVVEPEDECTCSYVKVTDGKGNCEYISDEFLGGFHESYTRK